jgi:hypothetical protein
VSGGNTDTALHLSAGSVRNPDTNLTVSTGFQAFVPAAVSGYRAGW